jgi:hypothetical protein
MCPYYHCEAGHLHLRRTAGGMLASAKAISAYVGLEMNWP